MGRRAAAALGAWALQLLTAEALRVGGGLGSGRLSLLRPTGTAETMMLRAMTEEGPPPKARDWSEEEQLPGMPKVMTGRSYIFLTHHKSGTNFMQQICNITAILTTGGRDQCAFCYRIRKPSAPGGRPTCVPDPMELHGPLRGTFSRFTLVSSINAEELKTILNSAPDFRAIHMVRDPRKMAMSAYAYNTWLATKEGEQFRWDRSAFFGKKNLTQSLNQEAKAICNPVKEMVGVDLMAHGEGRIITEDLEAFGEDFNGTTMRMLNHLFDTPPQDQLIQLFDNITTQDVGRWPPKRRNMTATVRASQAVNATAVAAEWEAMRQAGDPNVQSVTHYRETLGYGGSARRWARSY